MSDDEMMIHVTHGPYADQRLKMSKRQAEQAISEGWAVDPNKPVDPDKPPKELTVEERAKVIEAANKAATPLPAMEERDMHAQGGAAHYETKDVKAAPAKK